MADLEYLYDQKVFREVPGTPVEFCTYVDARYRQSFGDPWDAPPRPPGSLLKNLEAELSPQRRAILLSSSGRHPASLVKWDAVLPPGGEFVAAYAERIFCGDQSTAVASLSILPSAAELQLLSKSFLGPNLLADGRQTKVLEVVVEGLPSPGNDVALDELLSFARDPDNREKNLRLRLWMQRIASGTASANEIYSEFESLRNDFSTSMKSAKMKTDNRPLLLAVTLPFDVIDDLAHLKFGDAAREFFRFSNRKGNLLETELTAPGRELAYIDAASARFRIDAQN
ncbi:MAG: hypothetical protein ACYC19_08850 [Acidimicrobiales bacterium]